MKLISTLYTGVLVSDLTTMTGGDSWSYHHILSIPHQSLLPTAHIIYHLINYQMVSKASN